MSRTGRLVDLILEIAINQLSPEIKTLVGHRFPDDDVWLCCWMAKKFIPKAANAEIIFINAGDSLPGSEGDSSILHFDTGGGEYDQHGKGSKVSSATILAQKLELLSKHPGLKPLIELAEAVDNIKPLPLTSLHYAVEGYPRLPVYKNTNGHIDWQGVQERVFELFDIIYGQETVRIRNRENLTRHAEWTTLPNGIKIASLLWHPECREAAFETGTHVVVWTQSRGKNQFYTGIQTNRRYPVYLDSLVAALRNQETKLREIDVQGKNLRSIGRGPANVWYLHDSKHLILNGSRSWKLSPEEQTKMAPRQIVGLVHRALSAIPREIVSRWEKQK